MNDDCKLKFAELKAKQIYRYIIYKIDEKAKTIIVDKLGQHTLNVMDFVSNLPADDCRYAICVTESEFQESRIVFISWSPGNSSNIALYDRYKDMWRQELNGTEQQLGASNKDDLAFTLLS